MQISDIANSVNTAEPWGTAHIIGSDTFDVFCNSEYTTTRNGYWLLIAV